MLNQNHCGTVQHFSPGRQMEKTTRQKMIPRTALRQPTDAIVSCRTYSSGGDGRMADGVMRNYSSDGAYIEADRPFKPGTILIVRMIRYPTMAVDPEMDERPRSICLAEVRWQQERTDDGRPYYGMGLRYID